jgi:hypothetical protein
MKTRRKSQSKERILTYDELKLPRFVNSSQAAKIGNVSLTTEEVMAAGVLSGLSMLIIGHSEKGKKI